MSIHDFKNGVLVLDMSDAKQKKAAVSLAFNPANAESMLYLNAFKCIEPVKGISKKKKIEIVFDIVNSVLETQSTP